MTSKVYRHQDGTNRKVYEANEEEVLGVDAVKSLICQLMPEVEILINDEKKPANRKFVYDIICVTPDSRFTVEVNVKKDWKPGPDRRGRDWTVNTNGLDVPFIWDTIDYLWRKNDNGGKRELSEFMATVGGDYQRIFLNPRENLKEENVKSKWVRNTRTEEYFYQVPLPCEGSTWFELKGTTWVKH